MPVNGGCLIATAAYGSELAPQVQLLREIRYNALLSTESGTSFMTGFNQVYYSFSPAVADLERENPMFRDAVRVLITSGLYTMNIMTLADPGSGIGAGSWHALDCSHRRSLRGRTNPGSPHGPQKDKPPQLESWFLVQHAVCEISLLPAVSGCNLSAPSNHIIINHDLEYQ